MECKDKEITAMLLDAGLRVTKARCLVMQFIASSKTHPSEEEIERGLGARGYDIGTATLYQNLAKLVKAGLLRRFTHTDGLARYDAKIDRHYHLICSKCGRIRDVKVDSAAIAGLRPVNYHPGESLDGWQIEDVNVWFSGVCDQCRIGR